MERLILVPIERMEERYSDQWYRWFSQYAPEGSCFVGDTNLREIKNGEFLDVYETNKYKLNQLLKIIEKIEKGFEGTIFFFDLWFPGIQTIAYIRDTLKKKIRIEGMLHAGTWDDNDFLTQSGCKSWAYGFEKSFINLSDTIYVATQYHKNLIEDHLGFVQSDIKVVNFPCYSSIIMRDRHKENIVVFPHRLAIEKRPDIFDKVKELFFKKYPNMDVQFIKSKEYCSNKHDYYTLLAKSKVAFSSALQETFGIAMLESVNLGCIPVAPNRLSYRETLKDFKLYQSLDEAVDLIYTGLVNYKLPNETIYTKENCKKILEQVKIEV
jgi:glycosyltransferase involved in cell wall biosynthesis